MTPPSAPALDFSQAVREAQARLLSAEAGAVLLGDCVGRLGGAGGASRGLLQRFGPERVVDAPISAAGLVGLAGGLALGGGLPIVALDGADRLAEALEQLAQELPSRAMRRPVIVRAPCGGAGSGPFFEAAPERFLARIPGLALVSPSTPGDAAGLLLGAAAWGGPVVILEPRSLAGSTGPVPFEPIPPGSARIARPGSQATVLAWGEAVAPAIEGAEIAAARGFDAEVIDLRSLHPLDQGAIGRSVRRTGRAIACGPLARTLLATAAIEAFWYLESPLVELAGRPDPAELAAAIQGCVTA